MKFQSYLKSQVTGILAYGLLYILILLLLLAFRIRTDLILAISLLFLVIGLILLCYPFFRKKAFYDNIHETLVSLEQPYLLHSMIQRPDFLEGKILYDVLYESNKAMVENLNTYKNHLRELKEYIELWVHEIKIPISSCFLITHNHALEHSEKIEAELTRMEDLVEQVLYYSRSENVEKDYLIRVSSIKTMVRNVIQKNKDRILYKNIHLDIAIGEEKVRTDSKWLEFILHQILNNSIQYVEKENAVIQIWTEKIQNQTLLHIKDNGAGILKSDLPHVFEKGFTGTNGRKVRTSTGMGLYLVKRLAVAMNHQVQVDSQVGKYTTVTILFSETDFYDVI